MLSELVCSIAFTNCLTKFSSRTDNRLLDSLATSEWNSSDLFKDDALWRESDTGNSLSTKSEKLKRYICILQLHWSHWSANTYNPKYWLGQLMLWLEHLGCHGHPLLRILFFFFFKTKIIMQALFVPTKRIQLIITIY